MTTQLARRIAQSSHPLDVLRVHRAAQLLTEGLPRAEVMWRVMTDPVLGYSRWKKAPRARPQRDRALEYRLARLFARGGMELVAQGADIARAQFGAAAAGAAGSVVRMGHGEIDHRNTRAARIQLAANAIVLEGAGVIVRGGAQAVAIANAPSRTAEEEHRKALEEAERILAPEFTVRDAPEQLEGGKDAGSNPAPGA